MFLLSRLWRKVHAKSTLRTTQAPPSFFWKRISLIYPVWLSISPKVIDFSSTPVIWSIWSGPTTSTCPAALSKTSRPEGVTQTCSRVLTSTESPPTRCMVNGCHSLALRSSRIRSTIRYGYAQKGTPTRMAASVTRKIGSNHDELLVGLYEQRGHLLYLGLVDADARAKARGTQKTRGDSHWLILIISDPLPSIFFKSRAALKVAATGSNLRAILHKAKTKAACVGTTCSELGAKLFNRNRTPST